MSIWENENKFNLLLIICNAFIHQTNEKKENETKQQNPIFILLHIKSARKFHSMCVGI